MNVLLKRVVQRVILLVSSFILQIGIISFFLLKYSESFFDFYLASLTLSIIIVFIIINNKSNPSYKIAWIVPVMIFPIFGGLFYLLYGGNKLSTREKLKMVIQNIEMTNSLKQDDEIIKKIGDKSIYAKNQSEYILNYAKCPVYNNTETTYFKIGEEKFEALLRELKKAEKFIFLEYFIIQEGKMFNSILEILEEINPDIDFENCTTLIDDGLLDSFAILEIVAEINDAFDVEVSAPEIIPENFNSAQALWAMIQRLKD